MTASARFVLARVEADHPKTAEPAPKPTVVSLSNCCRADSMAVMVKVNGEGPYRLIFDTGSRLSLLDNKVAKEAGLLKDTPEPSVRLFRLDRGEVKARDLEVGGEKADECRPSLWIIRRSRPSRRRLGADRRYRRLSVLFPLYYGRLDYQAKTVTLVPNGFKPPDVMKAMMAAVMAAAPRTSRRYSAPAAQWGMIAAKEASDKEDGVTIKSVLPDSPAAVAGLKNGDRLLTLDGRGPTA